MPRISADQVQQALHDTVWKDGDGERFEVAGTLRQYDFSLASLEANRTRIGELLANVKVDVFDKKSGTAYISYQSAHYDRDGIRWTADDLVVDDLIVLGLATEMLARLAVPAEVETRYFPGGRPLYRITA